MFRQIVAILLIAFFVIYAVGNPVAAVHARRTGRSFSMVPLIGGLAGAIGFYLYPSGVYRPWWWLPLIRDIGCLPGIIVAIIYVTPQFIRHRRELKSAKIQQPCESQSSPPE